MMGDIDSIYVVDDDVDDDDDNDDDDNDAYNDKIHTQYVHYTVAKVLWTCVMQVQRKLRSDSVHVAPMETAGIFNVKMIPYCG